MRPGYEAAIHMLVWSICVTMTWKSIFNAIWSSRFSTPLSARRTFWKLECWMLYTPSSVLDPDRIVLVAHTAYCARDSSAEYSVAVQGSAPFVSWTLLYTMSSDHGFSASSFPYRRRHFGDAGCQSQKSILYRLHTKIEFSLIHSNYWPIFNFFGNGSFNISGNRSSVLFSFVSLICTSDIWFSPVHCTFVCEINPNINWVHYYFFKMPVSCRSKMWILQWIIEGFTMRRRHDAWSCFWPRMHHYRFL